MHFSFPSARMYSRVESLHARGASFWLVCPIFVNFFCFNPNFTKIKTHYRMRYKWIATKMATLLIILWCRIKFCMACLAIDFPVYMGWVGEIFFSNPKFQVCYVVARAIPTQSTSQLSIFLFGWVGLLKFLIFIIILKVR